MEPHNHSLTELLHASPHISSYPLDEELVLYDAAQDRTYILNATGKMVWERCDGAHTVQSLAREMAPGFGRPEEEVLADIRELVQLLSRAGLLTSGGKQQPQTDSLPEAEDEDQEIIRTARRFRQLTSR